MAKNKFYTKCGREFTKSTTAGVTGHTIDDSDKQCADCPFQVEVTKGWPAVHDRWECRAGSQTPNPKNEWSGDLEGKNTIHIKSLHNEFLEAVLEYCKGQADLGAGYNADLEDCRRTISVSCSGNKKGIAAKKDLIEKFFPVLDEKFEEDDCCCESCQYAEDYGESVKYLKCAESGKRKDVKKKQAACDNYVPVNDLVDNEFDGDLEEQLDELLKDGDKKDQKADRLCPYYVSHKEDKEFIQCRDMVNTKHVGWIQQRDNGDLYNRYFEQCCKGTYFACALYLQMKKKDEEKEGEAVISKSEKCISKTESCGYYCNHNGGCSLLLVGKSVLPDILKQFGKVDCDIWRETSKTVNETPKNITESLETVNETAEVVTFDYSTVDGETASFLQEKANRITEIRIKSVISIGKELKEAQDKLANHNKYEGVFVKWLESTGIKKSTAYDYLRAYEYVVRNSENMIDFDNVQPSLLFAISKPSAPAELQKAVMDGDITNHKQYQDLLKEKQEAEKQAKLAEEARSMEYKMRMATQERDSQVRDELTKTKQILTDKQSYIKNINNERDSLVQQLRQAKDTGNSEEIKRLQAAVIEQAEKLDKLYDEKEELHRQLKEKPIEVPATQIVEKVPEGIRASVADKLDRLFHDMSAVSQVELQLFASGITESAIERYQDILQEAISKINFFSSLLEPQAEAAATYERITAPCEDCEYSSWDGLKEFDENAGKVICTMYNELVTNENGCKNFKER